MQFLNELGHAVSFARDEVAVCFYRGGALIRWQTRGVVGHTAVYWPTMACWVEADVGQGNDAARHPEDVGKRGVVRRVVERADRVGYAIVRLPQYDAACRFSRETLGLPYDLRMIIRFITRQPEAEGTRSKYFCSEHTGEALRRGGLVPLAHSEPWEESPEDLWRSPVLFPVAG